tara:strand:- start:477 stop:617 length:141 start_codon:yes stop_codon:yes gene_type:complete
MVAKDALHAPLLGPARACHTISPLVQAQAQAQAQVQAQSLSILAKR